MKKNGEFFKTFNSKIVEPRNFNRPIKREFSFFFYVHICFDFYFSKFEAFVFDGGKKKKISFFKRPQDETIKLENSNASARCRLRVIPVSNDAKSRDFGMQRSCQRFLAPQTTHTHTHTEMENNCASFSPAGTISYSYTARNDFCVSGRLPNFIRFRKTRSPPVFPSNSLVDFNIKIYI